MATVNELAYDLAELMGKPFDAAFVRQAAFNLNIYRGLIIKQEMDKKNGIVDPIYLQTIDCIDLEYVDAGECCGVCTGTKILRTKEQLPIPITMRGGSFTYVGGIDNSKSYQQITLNRLQYTLLDRFPKLTPEYYYQDSRLYFTGTTAKVIKVQGIFEDPTAVAELQCASSTSSGNCDPLEVDFPAPANIVARMWQAMLGGKFRMKIFDQDDDSNTNIKEA